MNSTVQTQYSPTLPSKQSKPAVVKSTTTTTTTSTATSNASRPCIKQRSASSYANSSAFSTSAHANENWTQITDLAERRRIQNRIAQRNYRKKQKRRLADLERRANSTSASPEPEPEPILRHKPLIHRPTNTSAASTMTTSRPPLARPVSPPAVPKSAPTQPLAPITSSYELNSTPTQQQYLVLPEDRFITRSNSISSYTSYDTAGTGATSYSQSPIPSLPLPYSVPSPELVGGPDYKAYAAPRHSVGIVPAGVDCSAYTNYLKQDFYRDVEVEVEDYPTYNDGDGQNTSAANYAYASVNQHQHQQHQHHQHLLNTQFAAYQRTDEPAQEYVRPAFASLCNY